MVKEILCGCAGVLAMSTGVSASATSTTPCAAYWHTAAVFSGRVASIARAGPERRVTFTVIERFRGAGASTVTLALHPGAPCASRFRQEREFVVYAQPASGGASSMVLDCSRTRDIGDAAADLSYARSVADGSAPIGTISGQVLTASRDLAGRIAGPARPAAEVAVRVIHDGAEDRSITNQAGDFVVPARGAGSYTVTVDVPPRYYAEAAAETIELSDPRACGEVELRLGHDGRLAGRVFDSAGRPLPGLTIEASTNNLAERRLAVTDRNGDYEFARLPAGRFVIGVESGAPVRAGTSPRMYLPGVASAATALRLRVGEGERVAAPDFRLPPSITYVAVTGFVLDADGQAAEGAHVYVKGVAEGDRIVGEPVAVDFLGRFAVAVLAGSDRVIFAERRRGARVDSSDQIRVSANAVQTPTRLVLERRY